MKERRGRNLLALFPLDLDGYLLNGDWNSGKAPQVLQRLAARLYGLERDNGKFFSGIVLNQNDLSRLHTSPPESGIVNRNVDPCPSAESTKIWP